MKAPPIAPGELRTLIREGKWTGPTAGLAPGYVQANLVVLPRDCAYDFLLLCQRNPKPCPLLEVLDAGCPEPKQMAPGADIRTDLPRYRIYRHGALVSEVETIGGHWREDFVSFLLGCSNSFYGPMQQTGVVVRHLAEGKSDPTYITNIETVPAGVFSGPLVVSMWPVHSSQVARVVQVTSRFPAFHGAPVHIGEPSLIGIRDLRQPDYGEPVELRADEVAVFFACGVTPQAVALRSKPPLMITHSPGHMFITGVLAESLAVI